MDAENYHDFLERYAAGQYAESEHQAFRQWLLQAPPEQVQAALDRYAELQRYQLTAAPPPETVAALEARLDALPTQDQPAAPRRWRLAVAASVALLISVGVYLLLPGAWSPAVAYRQQQTGPNQTTRLTLPDGSVVHLNRNSYLSYPVAFGGPAREVYLRGEAYFEVAKDPAHPFLIHSGRLQTRVVGTSFNVYAYPQAQQLEVTVLTGRVVVTDSASQRAVTLQPAQQAVLTPATATLSRELAPNPRLSLAWQQGKLSFDQAPLPTIADKLALRYGVHITLNNAQLQHCRLTVEFGQESLAQVLEVLSALTGSTYTQQQQHIILTGPGC
ncbi:FecR family protein [Hymenobacter sp. YC55]|uniref:FecR family protein n=1 Tax=Hymenobacter sp. YC55 TaxID=3034019 RepID=UPI0023F69C38|nr:FecR family protein [Hymenobacter sp. YC55]MDF7813976.1 FecR domain-containing protein [Hymenobacter sp. YC55]